MIGETLLHYTVLERLGEGEMGVVYSELTTSRSHGISQLHGEEEKGGPQKETGGGIDRPVTSGNA